MWPWGHAAVGYLCYSALRLARGNGLPVARPTVLAVGVGTQVPDLVDKPLAWGLGLLPGGRSLAHSFLILLPLLGVLWALTDSDSGGSSASSGSGSDSSSSSESGSGNRRLVAAFGVGLLSHPLADALYPVLGGDLRALTFLLWPLLGLPAYDPSEYDLLGHLLSLRLTPDVAFEFALAAAAAAVWLYGRRTRTRNA